MKVMDVTETESGIILRYRALPALLKALFYAGCLGFGAYVVFQVWPEISAGHGSWLPPFDQLPAWAKQAIIFMCLGISLLICFIPLYKSTRVFLCGECWHFDTLRHLVIRDEKEIAALSEVMEIVVEGDFRGDSATVTLYLLMKNGTKIRIIDAMMVEQQFRHFMDAGERIAKKTKLPCVRKSLGDPEGWW